MLAKSQIKYIQSLSQKKHRDEEGVFVAEGPKIINELLGAPNIELRQLYATPEWLRLHKQDPAVSITEISVDELERISMLSTPNQVLGVFSQPVFSQAIQLRYQVTLMLDTIQDPGNLGTIVRCADWFNIRQIICSPGCADIFNPKVVQSTMGSIARVRVVYDNLLHYVQRPEVKVLAATLDGQDIRAMERLREGIVLIGNESKGIDGEILRYCPERITILRQGEAESLNAAVATGILLSHLT